MKKFSIFRPGTHTASDGSTIVFTEEDIAGLVSSYNPEIHEAPIVVGHPKDNAPAYGWISGLSLDAQNAFAEPAQVTEEFSEWVKAGHYKKRSASLYPPDSPSNPVPGKYYLRHIGFLGAQPPAIKGMPDATFAEEEGILEFADPQYTASILSRIMRGLREWMIGEKGLEKADKFIPGYLVEDLEAEARIPAPETPLAPGFAEGANQPGDTTVLKQKTPEQLQAETDQLTADTAALTADTAALAKKQVAFAESQAVFNRARLSTYTEGLAKAGKIPAARAEELTDFMAGLPGDTEIEFGEKDKKQKASMEDWFRGFMEAQPTAPLKPGTVIDGDDHTTDAIDPEELSIKAIAYQEEQRQAGRVVNIVDAVRVVSAAALT